jgi:hypothetical protein
MRRRIRSLAFAFGTLAFVTGAALAQAPSPSPPSGAGSPAPAVPAPAPVAPPSASSAPVAPAPPRPPVPPGTAPSAPRAVTIRDPVAAKPCVSATRKLEREKSSLDTAQADVARYQKLAQGCHSKLTCARYAAALAWLGKRVDRHQRRIERFDASRKAACNGA